MSGLRTKVEDVRRRIKQNQERYDELVRYAKVMSDGYVTSISVMIDMTALLTAFKELLEDLSRIGMSGEGFTTLQKETIQKLNDLSTIFNSQYSKIEGFLSTEDPEYLTKLSKIKEAFDRARSAQPKVSGGRLRIKKSNKV